MLASHFVFEVEPKHRWSTPESSSDLEERERIEIGENNLGRQSTGPQQNIAQAHSKTQARLSRAPAQPTGDIFDNSLLPRTLTIYVQTSGRRGDFSPREINPLDPHWFTPVPQKQPTGGATLYASEPNMECTQLDT